MSTFKKLASDTALYGLSTILGRMLNWLLVIVHTYVFARPARLSSNVEIYSYMAVLLLIYTLGMESAFFRYAARQKERLQEYFDRSLSIVMVVSIVLSGLILLFAEPIAELLHYPDQVRYVRWAAWILAIDAIMAIPFARLRVQNQARRFVTAKLINIFVNIGLNLFFLIVCDDVYHGRYLSGLKPLVDAIYDPAIGPGYIFLANLIANALYVFFLWDTFRGFRLRLERSEVVTLVNYAFPLMLTGLIGVVNQTTDRIFLRYFLPEGFYPGLTSEDALGIYGNCYKLSVFMALAIQSFKFAADPFFFSRGEDKNAPGLLAQVTKWFVIVCVIIWVGVSLNLDVLGLFIGKAYRSGLGIVPILMLANLILGVYYNIAFWFKLSDKTMYGTLITALGAGSTLLLNMTLIPAMGYMGCAVAFLISSVVMCWVCYVLGNKHYPVPYNVRSALGYIAAGGLLIYLSAQITIPDLRIAIPYHLLLFGLFLGAVFVVERKTFVPALARLRKRKAAVSEE